MIYNINILHEFTFTNIMVIAIGQTLYLQHTLYHSYLIYIFFLYSLLLFVNPYLLCSIYLRAITLSSLRQSYWLKLHDFVACHILWICQIILFFWTDSDILNFNIKNNHHLMVQGKNLCNFTLWRYFVKCWILNIKIGL